MAYSDSYSGLLNSALPIISDFPYVIAMLAAFDSLLMDNYHAYILTLELYTVAIYGLPNGRCKIFTLMRFIRYGTHLQHVLQLK